MAFPASTNNWTTCGKCTKTLSNYHHRVTMTAHSQKLVKKNINKKTYKSNSFSHHEHNQENYHLKLTELIENKSSPININLR